MELEKNDLICAIHNNAKELQQGIDVHCGLLTLFLEGLIDGHKMLPLRKPCLKPSRELRLEKAIREAIEELEESRKAFKSKRLELLRKKLTQTLLGAD